jgi:cytidyltransferase-like protein
MRKVAVTGSFDDLRSRHVRFLEEASKWGELHVFLWSDETVHALEGKTAKFPEQERLYLCQAVRYVSEVRLVRGLVERDVPLEVEAIRPDIWVVDGADDTPRERAHAKSRGVEYRVLKDEDLKGFPVPPLRPTANHSGRKRVIVTGCYDWFHSGHVRFFEEVSGLGDLYVVVGHDANVRLLKGEGHPMFSQDERRYLVHSVRYVKHSLISSGHGWLDSEPEISIIKPEIYAVNEDGDKPEKRALCAARGIQYVVLRRVPKEGLPGRQSTELRDF